MKQCLKRAVMLQALLASVLAVTTAAWGQTSEQCAAAMTLQFSGVALEVTKAEWFPAGSDTAQRFPGSPITSPLPAYCRVDGMIDRRVGAQGKPYGIGFAIALPDNWNGRFLFQGGGGLNGSVRPPRGPLAAGNTPALARGFAVVSTDTGHQGGGFDGGPPAFFSDQQASLDFAYVAVGRVAVLAKQLIARYYGRSPDHSYYAGCSTGGREGMLMAQRYPTYFDGIVSGAPAMRTGYSLIATRAVGVALNLAAPKDATGKPNPGALFSEGDKKLIVNAVLAACDAKDGLTDGMIFNTRACSFDPAVLTCKGAKTEACLTSEQTGALEKAFSATTDSRGNQVYPRFLYDTGITGAFGLLNFALSPLLGPANLATKQDVDQEAAAVAADPLHALGYTASWTNLTTFSSRGGKWLFYHGVSDPIFSALATVEYYEKIGEANGGADQVRGWSRLFLQPGMSHCGAGDAALDRFDLLGAVVDWVEKGVAPDSVISTGRAFPGRSRPLCPYPTYAHYKGEGDPEDAQNFVCRQ